MKQGKGFHGQNISCYVVNICDVKPERIYCILCFGKVKDDVFGTDSTLLWLYNLIINHHSFSSIIRQYFSEVIVGGP